MDDINDLAAAKKEYASMTSGEVGMVIEMKLHSLLNRSQNWPSTLQVQKA